MAQKPTKKAAAKKPAPKKPAPKKPAPKKAAPKKVAPKKAAPKKPAPKKPAPRKAAPKKPAAKKASPKPAAAAKTLTTLTVNGVAHDLLIEPNRTLLDVLRVELDLTGAKHGCGVGECGSCTVLVDGRPVNSCLILAVSCVGKRITTVEGLAADGELTALQKSFIEHGAIQCGFCTPGMILTSTALLAANPSPTETEVREAISGNLCRCTGYQKIVEAVLAVAHGEDK
jgi:carbon-monoxide dehydrogenase small subunit